MMKIAVIVALMAMFALMLCAPGLAGAATPTPSPTLRPIQPSPTSAYLYLRPTPTPITIVPLPGGITFLTDGGPMADAAISTWQIFNHDHVLDFIICCALFLMTIYMMMRMAGRNSRPN